MGHRILRWFAPVLVAGFVCLSSAHAQGVYEGGEGSKTAALPYTFAFVFTLLVMVIVCAPSRKSVRD